MLTVISVLPPLSTFAEGNGSANACSKDLSECAVELAFYRCMATTTVGDSAGTLVIPVAMSLGAIGIMVKLLTVGKALAVISQLLAVWNAGLSLLVGGQEFLSWLLYGQRLVQGGSL